MSQLVGETLRRGFAAGEKRNTGAATLEVCKKKKEVRYQTISQNVGFFLFSCFKATSSLEQNPSFLADWSLQDFHGATDAAAPSNAGAAPVPAAVV